PSPHATTLKRVRRLSHLLDNAIPLPGGYRIGLDPIIGLLPGGGDLVTGLMSVYIVVEGVRLGMPASTLGRMGTNILLEVILGTIPLFGDLFDVAWKANVKNAALLERHLGSPRPPSLVDRLLGGLIIAALVALVVGVSVLIIELVRWVLGWGV
ncbi:DUF4112 domain-containing protein, partial [Romeria aff. gracilis LEGE 07310]